ncbi:MAG: tetratricopeptide repeat protein [Opitutae bacterium]|nr:tetratricopeptide repeat protein [Opitutae bacterium]
MVSNKILSVFQTAAAHHKAGRLQEAARLYAQVRASAPQLAEAWQLSGLVAQQLDQLAEAVSHLERAVKLAPRSADMNTQLGIAYVKRGRAADAERQLRIAIQLKPDHHEAWANLGYTLQVLNRVEEALAAYRRMIEIKPDAADGWYGLGIGYSLLGQHSESLAAHERAMKVDPHHPHARFGRAMALQQSHCIREAVADYSAHLARFPQHHDARSYRLFALNYLADVSREQLFAEHVAYGDIFEPPAQRQINARRVWTNSREPERRLRVGFLSPDLRQHSVAYFLEPLLANLDKKQFEILLFHDHYQEDAVSARLRGYAAVWRNFVSQMPAQVETTLRTFNLDILIDLTGHTGMNRLQVFAKRIAPVQVTYLGYPNTTGLPSMDYRLTDELADPTGDADRFHTEKLIRFAPTAWSYSPPEEAPGLNPPPCLSGAPVTFGSFNALSKLTDTTLQLWRKVLEATPGSRLLLKSCRRPTPEWERHLDLAGIPRERLGTLPPQPDVTQHLACYGQIDIALDAFPYHGTTTTCEALWMGVPVLTLAGDRHASRVGVSLLHAIGHPELVATDSDDYIAKATALAADTARLETLRRSLRSDMRRSPLLDHAGQAARFSAALRDMWRTWCARSPAP